MSLNIQLEKDTYYPGERVKGVLSIDVPKPLRAREVQLAFVGKEHTKVVRGSGKHRTVYIEDHIIVEDVVSVWVASPNGYLGPCNEMFPFEFQIPISYEIKAKIDKPLAIDPNVKCYIQVMPLPIENYPARAIVETFQEPRGKDHLEVVVDKNAYIPGETVSGRVKFKRDPAMKARGVECAVLFTESATAHNRTDSYPYIIGQTRWEIDPDGEYYEWPFSIQTYQSGDYSLEGILITRVWMVDVKVDLPRKRDQHVQVPLLFLPLRSPATP